MVRRILWNIYFWPVFAFITFISVLFLPLLMLCALFIYRCSPGSALRRLISSYGCFLTRIVPFFAPVEVEYHESLPEVAILVSNHNSAIDPYLFGCLLKEGGFVTSSWPFRIPVYGTIMRLAGYANIEKGWEEVRKSCLRMLDEKCSVIIWPEGHRSRDGSLGRFRNGAFSLAVESGVPIVPVCILGSRDILAPGERFLRCGRVKLLVLPQIAVGEEEREYGKKILALRKSTYAAIDSALNEYGHFADGK